MHLVKFIGQNSPKLRSLFMHNETLHENVHDTVSQYPPNSVSTNTTGIPVLRADTILSTEQTSSWVWSFS